MKTTDALRGVSRIFLDTAPIVYYIEKNLVYLSRVDAVFDRLSDGLLMAVTSPVTLAETLIHHMRRGLVQLQSDCYDLIVLGENTQFVTTGAEQARRAAELRAHYNLSLTDALQVSCALDARCDAFLTNDLGLKRVTEIQIIVLDALDA